MHDPAPGPAPATTRTEWPRLILGLAAAYAVGLALPFTSLERVMERFGLNREEISSALDLPTRTLARRKQERRLRRDESDRLFRLVRIAEQATQVLGSRDKASMWLHTSNRALGGQPPLTLLDTDLGARQVEEILGRIEYGVYS